MITERRRIPDQSHRHGTRASLRHSYREKLLNTSEFNFLCVERDPANLAALEAELSQLKPFPVRVNVETSEGDTFERLSNRVVRLP